MTGPDCAVMCSLIHPPTHTQRDRNRAGSRGYVQFDRCTHARARHGICRMPGDFARRHGGGPPVEGNLRQESGMA